jgi:hypothetical protein
MKRKSRKAFHIIVFTKYVFFFNFALGRGCSPGSPPPYFGCANVAPTSSLALWYSLHTSDSTSVQMATPEFAADTRFEFQATIKLCESSGVKYSWRVVKFTSQLLYPWERTPMATQHQT